MKFFGWILTLAFGCVLIPATIQAPAWARVRVGQSPLTLDLPAALKELESDGGLAVYSKAQDVKAWEIKSGTFEMQLQVFPKSASENFVPVRAIGSAEALSRSVYGDRLNPDNLTRAGSIEGGFQIEESIMAVSDESDKEKKIAYGFWAAWDGEWGCIAKYRFEQKDLELAQRVVSSRRFIDIASGLYRFQTGVPGLRFLLPAPMSDGEETLLHNPAWFEGETTYKSSSEGAIYRFTELHVKKGVKADLATVEKALKWQVEAQKKQADVSGVVSQVDRAPLAGQQVVRATTTYLVKDKKRRAIAYGMTVGETVWCLLAIFDDGESKAAGAAQRVWESGKVISSP